MTALDAGSAAAAACPLPAVPRRPLALAVERLRTALPAGLVLTLWVGAVLQLAHQGQHERHEIAPVLHWLRDSALALPAAVVAVAVGLVAARRLLAWAELPTGGTLQRAVAAGLGGLAFAVLSVPGSWLHAALFAAEHEGLIAAGHAGYEASLVLLASTSVLVALPSLSPLFATVGRRLRAAASRWARAGRAGSPSPPRSSRCPSCSPRGWPRTARTWPPPPLGSARRTRGR
jgi:hypothetical protein